MVNPCLQSGFVVKHLKMEIVFETGRITVKSFKGCLLLIYFTTLYTITVELAINNMVKEHQ